jgi:hypothetical protein
VFFAQHYVLYPTEADPEGKGAAKLVDAHRPSDRFEIVYLTSPEDEAENGGGRSSSGGLDEMDDDDDS